MKYEERIKMLLENGPAVSLEEPELVICGGGHVSLELSVLADYLEYTYTVIDDRTEFASRERFPRAKECICQPFGEVLKTRQFSANAYYIIVTRGHAHDLECLELILQKSYGYVGMIGSRSKVRLVMDTLEAKGFSKEQLSEVHAPIGLPIGGETPKEVAVSIISQLIQVRNKEQSGSYLDHAMKEQLKSEEPMVMVTIIEKKGSAPRGVGSRMLVGKNGILCGTVGGGTIEYEAVKEAMAMVGTTDSMTKWYRLDSDSAASLGMWCGGQLHLLFQGVI